MDDSTPRGASRETLIADALVEVFRMLDAGESTPESRGLRAQARFYDRAVKHWVIVPPTFVQLDAMFDLVIELHGKTVSTWRARSTA